MLRRRRPLLGAAMLGGAAYAGRKSQQRSYREQDQEARLEGLEQQQQQAAPVAAPAPPPAAPATAAPAASSSLVDQLKQLSDLKAAGALSDAEFEAAKQKLLAS